MMETTERIYNSTTNPKPSQIGSGMQNLVPKPPHALFSRKQPLPVNSKNKNPDLVLHANILSEEESFLRLHTPSFILSFHPHPQYTKLNLKPAFPSH